MNLGVGGPARVLLDRGVLLAMFDGLAWVLAVLLAALLRLNGDLSRLGATQLLLALALAVALESGFRTVSHRLAASSWVRSMTRCTSARSPC